MRRRVVRPVRRGPRALWAIIYIDLMTQIMVFFVILWSIEQHQREPAPAGPGTGVGMGDRTARMVDLPSDILFASGKSDLAAEGRGVFEKLFGDPSSGVLDFDQGGLARRKLAIHGHTDDVGGKEDNFLLGFQRAWSVYREIRRYSDELPEHVVLCTHADNTPEREVPPAPAQPDEAQRAAAQEARAANRRITIEDVVIDVRPPEGAGGR